MKKIQENPFIKFPVMYRFWIREKQLIAVLPSIQASAELSNLISIEEFISDLESGTVIQNNELFYSSNKKNLMEKFGL